jgi:hypothetical protein
MRLIDVDAMHIDFDKYIEHIRLMKKGRIPKTEIAILLDCTGIINNAPTVDAVPVRHGKWIDEGQYADYHPHHAWRCSECGEHVIEVDTPWYKYCPNCGARMDEE